MNRASSAMCGCLLAALVCAVVGARPAAGADGVFVRVRLEQPADTTWYVRFGAHIHVDPWSLPAVVWPEGADRYPSNRLAPGAFSPWFDLGAYGGKRLHGRHSRAGGIAEFPNITAVFVSSTNPPRRRVTIELATAPDPAAVVKRITEEYEGEWTSFLVSPRLRDDAAALETAAEMSARRLAWAREASGGVRNAPTNLIVQTGLWGPQRPELNLQEAETLRLLGFNVVGGQTREIRERYAFGEPGHSWVNVGPAVTREAADAQMKQAGEQLRKRGGAMGAGMPYNFSDEITAPAIGTNAAALAAFHAWLKERRIKPGELGAKSLDEVVPIESPAVLRERQAAGRAAANRVFYYASRFRQESATERFRWLTESFHAHVSTNALTSTLPADHPYFAGTGLGMGMGPNPAWGSTPLAADWFDLGRCRAVDLMGIEDWMGLQFMYGPNYTWEGFQLMGFQAAIFRSASKGEMPVIAWVTPSDFTNLTLKSTSALCQGAKHLFFWTYGPTSTSTENYWSDLRSAHDGMVRLARQRAFAEPVLAPGRTRPTRVALLYAISSDLWQPFGYVHMLERRMLYLALTHAQFGVDLLSEQDVVAGRLGEYGVLYTADPCIREDAMAAVARWVKGGGYLVGTCAAGSRNEFDEEVPGLGPVFGLGRGSVKPSEPQAGPFHIRAGLNAIPDLDRYALPGLSGPPTFEVGAIGVRVSAVPEKGTRVVAAFSNGEPAVVSRDLGRGGSLYVASCPGIAYGKAARFEARALAERWPAAHREFLVAPAVFHGGLRRAELSEPVVEAGVYDAPGGSALVLANFTYSPVTNLAVGIRLPFEPARVVSAERGPVPFSVEPVPAAARAAAPELRYRCAFGLDLGLNDIVLFLP